MERRAASESSLATEELFSQMIRLRQLSIGMDPSRGALPAPAASQR